MSSFQSYAKLYANRVKPCDLTIYAEGERQAFRVNLSEIAYGTDRPELTNYLVVDAAAAPALAALALAWAAEHGELDRVIRNLDSGTLERLALAWRNFEAEERERYMGDAADAAAKDAPQIDFVTGEGQ